MDARLQLLDRWANSVAQAARAGVFGRGVKLTGIETVNGPRAGALEVHAGLESGRLLRILSADEHAIHRQFVPWRFAGEPSVYMVSRFVRLEAGWPDEIAERDIPLSTIGSRPRGGGRWIAGKDEAGATITLGLSDAVPHYLFGGWTGSGKTWTMRSALAQLSRDRANGFVLVDAKYGDGLGCLEHMEGVIGPVAKDPESAKRALAWTVKLMKDTYERGGRGTTRTILAIDEIQELTGRNGDPAIIEMIRRLVAQGRGAGIHVMIGTQHPISDAFSDPTIRRNLTGRVALKTEDYKASEVVVGGQSPRADHLLGAGDAYAIVPGSVHRAQMAYIPKIELERMCTSQPIMDAWPEYDAEAAGSLPMEEGAGWKYTGEELAVALVQAHQGKGRPALVQALGNAGLGKPGSVRAQRLLDIGRTMRDWLNENYWELTQIACLPGD